MPNLLTLSIRGVALFCFSILSNSSSLLSVSSLAVASNLSVGLTISIALRFETGWEFDVFTGWLILVFKVLWSGFNEFLIFLPRSGDPKSSGLTSWCILNSGVEV